MSDASNQSAVKSALFPREAARASWWAAVLATAATYFYFLIFAEFAFLNTASAVAVSPDSLRWLLAGLGGGGILGAVLAALAFHPESAPAHLRWAFRACAAAAALSLVASHIAPMLVASVTAGGSLGWLTVALASALRRATGGARLGLAIGTGTGLAYAACNLPVLFHATPAAQTVAAILVVVAASFLPRWMRGSPDAVSPNSEYRLPAAVRWIAILLALVWMDSAAFYIIQHTPGLRATTWGDGTTLLLNAAMHLIASIAAGLLLDRERRGLVATLAVGTLALACLILSGGAFGVSSAGLFYTAGVSLYSTLLVDYPARSQSPRLAAAVFAIAGWCGSALGIGMAEELNRIPLSFVAVSFATVLAALAWRAVTLRTLLLVSLVAVLAPSPSSGGEVSPTIQRGREVYIAEGCIHCHSQFIRPRAPDDVERWGPVTTLAEALAAAPPLFGTRRQGPDLSHVGNRRSPEWNRLHLIAPRTISPGSRMPAYAHLFSLRDDRGDTLLAYLSSLGAESTAERFTQISQWSPSRERVLSPDKSRALFLRLCAQCHGKEGRADGPLVSKLTVAPPNWSVDPWRHVRATEEIDTQLCRIIKFGLPGLAMAGHEYLPDADVAGLAQFVRALHKGAINSPSALLQP